MKHHAKTESTELRILLIVLSVGTLIACDPGDAFEDEAPDTEQADENLHEADQEPLEFTQISEWVEPMTVRELLADYPPEFILEELSPDELDRPVGMQELRRAVDVDGNGVLDAFDTIEDFAASTADDPLALGEAACTTVSLSSPHGQSVPMTVPPQCGIAFDGSISPNASYNPVGCPHQYITEVTGTSGKPLSFYWNWHGVSLNQENCHLASVNITAWGQLPVWPPSASWVKLGESSLRGEWRPLLKGFPPSCVLAHQPGSTPLPSLGNNHMYMKVRTAAQATALIFKQKVESGVRHGPGPC